MEGVHLADMIQFNLFYKTTQNILESLAHNHLLSQINIYFEIKAQFIYFLKIDISNIGHGRL